MILEIRMDFNKTTASSFGPLSPGFEHTAEARLITGGGDLNLRYLIKYHVNKQMII